MMKYLILACLLAVLVDCQSPPQSPCPQVFRYDSLDSANGLWTGTLVARTPHVLHGVWIRLIFTKPVNEIETDNGFEAVPSEDKREYLVKNKDLLLRGNRAKMIKITVKFGRGDETPELIEYRLNAVTVCPNMFANRTDFYPSDPAAAKTDYLQSITSEEEDSKPQPACGNAPSAAPNQIPETFPWQAALFTKLADEENYTCEATLVNDKYLITAAHCVTYLTTRIPLVPERLVVYLGRKNIDQRNGEPLSVSRIVLYPGYQPENLLNDLALVELKEAAKLDDKIAPVCLPAATEAAAAASGDKREILTGYRLENGKFSKLSSEKIDRISRADCFKDSNRLRNFLGDNNYCASYLQGDAAAGAGCTGDSGSPSLIQSEGKWQLRGVLSLGVGLQGGDRTKCDPSRNVVFTEIARFSRWLSRNIA